MEFPTVTKIRRGAILRTIAHSAWIVDNRSFLYEVSWDGTNYNRQDTQGARGTVTFNEELIVGLFFDEHSKSNPFVKLDEYDFHKFMSNMPDAPRQIAYKETSQYLLDNLNGVVMPIVTAAFWSEGSTVIGNALFKLLLEDGLRLIYLECLPDEEAIVSLQEEYGLSDVQISAIWTVFMYKISVGYDSKIYLQKSTFPEIFPAGIDIDDSISLLQAIGIFLI